MFLSAIILHFLFDLTGKNILIGFISPINESIFEHTKLIFIPLIICYLIYFNKHKNSLDKNRWFFTSLLSISIGIILVPMIYYGYTESLGIELIYIDILMTLIILFISNIFFYVYYNNYNFAIKKELSIIILILLFVFYAYASLKQINLPIFISP